MNTIVRKIALMLFFLISVSGVVSGQTTLYTTQDADNWSEPASWSTVRLGVDNDANLIPGVNTGASVDVVICSNTTVRFNLTQNLEIGNLTFEEGGKLIINGDNYLKVASISGPGDIELKSLANVRVGTQNELRTFPDGNIVFNNNVTIDMTSGGVHRYGGIEILSGTATVKGNFVLSKNLKIAGGTFRFADGANAKVTIGGDIEVASGATLTSATSSSYKTELFVSGNIYNDGTIDFTDASKQVTDNDASKAKRVLLKFHQSGAMKFINNGTAKLFSVAAQKNAGSSILVTNNGTLTTSASYLGKRDYTELPWSVSSGELILGDGIKITNWGVPDYGTQNQWGFNLSEFTNFQSHGSSMYIPAGATLTINGSGTEVNAGSYTKDYNQWYTSSVFIAGTLNMENGILRLPEYSYGLFFVPSLTNGEAAGGTPQLIVSGTANTKVYTPRVGCYVTNNGATQTPGHLNISGSSYIYFSVLNGRYDSSQSNLHSASLTLLKNSQFSMSGGNLIFENTQFQTGNCFKELNGMILGGIDNINAQPVYTPISYNVTGGNIYVKSAAISEFRIYGADMQFNRFVVQNGAKVKFIGDNSGANRVTENVYIKNALSSEGNGSSIDASYFNNLYIEKNLEIKAGATIITPMVLNFSGNSNGTYKDATNSVVWKNVVVNKTSNSRYIEVSNGNTLKMNGNLTSVSGSMRGSVEMCGSELQTIEAQDATVLAMTDLHLNNTTAGDCGVTLISDTQLRNLTFDRASRLNIASNNLYLFNYPTTKTGVSWGESTMIYTDNSPAAKGVTVPLPTAVSDANRVHVGTKNNGNFFYSYVKPLYTSSTGTDYIQVTPVQAPQPEVNDGDTPFNFYWKIQSSYTASYSGNAYQCHVVNKNQAVMGYTMVARQPGVITSDGYHSAGEKKSYMLNGTPSSYTIDFGKDNCDDTSCPARNSKTHLSGDFTLVKDGFLNIVEDNLATYTATTSGDWKDKIWKNSKDNKTYYGAQITVKDKILIPNGKNITVTDDGLCHDGTGMFSHGGDYEYFKAAEVHIEEGASLSFNQKGTRHKCTGFNSYDIKENGSFNIFDKATVKAFKGDGKLQFNNITENTQTPYITHGPDGRTTDYSQMAGSTKATIEFVLGVNITNDYINWSGAWPNVRFVSMNTTTRKIRWFTNNGTVNGNYIVGPNIVSTIYGVENTPGMCTINGKLVVEQGGKFRLLANRGITQYYSGLFKITLVGGIENDGTIELGDMNNTHTASDGNLIYIEGDIENNGTISWGGLNSYFQRQNDQKIFGTQVTKGKTNLGIMHLNKTSVSNSLTTQIPLGDGNGIADLRIEKGIFYHSYANKGKGLLSYCGADDFNIPSGCKFQVNVANSDVCLIVKEQSNRVKLEGTIQLVNNTALSIKDRNGNSAGIGYADKASINTSSSTVDLSFLAPFTGADVALTFKDYLSTYTFNEGAVPASCGVLDFRTGSNVSISKTTFNIKNSIEGFPVVNYCPSSSTISNPPTTSLNIYQTTNPVTIKATEETCNINVKGAGKAQIVDADLSINTSLTIEAGAEFDCRGYDLTLSGSLLVNNGATFTTGLNTVNFINDKSNAILKITSPSPIAINNLFQQVAGRLDTPAGGLTVEGDMEVDLGTLNANYPVTVNGNLTVRYGTTILGDNGYIKMSNNTKAQKLICEGSIRNLYIDNARGVNALDHQTYPIIINNELRMINGVLSIGGNMLEMAERAKIIADGTSFSATKMIMTNGSSADRGIKLNMRQNAVVRNFIPVLPIGSNGKYTPITFDANVKVNEAGSLTFICNDGYSESIVTDAASKENVLNYYWLIQASDDIVMSNNGKMTLSGLYSDAKGYDADNYFGAHLEEHSGRIRKYEGVVTVASPSINTEFYLGGTHAEICGIYTCGNKDNMNDQVRTYISIADGMWDDQSIWREYDIVTGTIKENGIVTENKNGCGIIIGSNVTLAPANERMKIYFLRVQADGIIDFSTAKSNSFGTITGTGKIIVRGTFPAGNFEDFFSVAGGTIEYAGDNVDYNVFVNYAYHNKVIFSGSGKRNLPKNQDVSTFGEVTINDDVQLVSNNSILKIKKNLYLNGGSNPGTGCIIFNGDECQSVDFSGGSLTTYDLSGIGVDNSLGVIVDSDLTVRQLQLIKGVIYSGDNVIAIESTNPTITRKDANSFVDGFLSLNLVSGSAMPYYIGASGRPGAVDVKSAVNGKWRVRYYNGQHPEAEAAKAALEAEGVNVNYIGNDYWVVLGPNDQAQAQVKLRWDEMSGGFDTGSCVVSYGKSIETGTVKWESVGYKNDSKNAYSGTLWVNQLITYANAGEGRVYILGVASEYEDFRWVGSFNDEWSVADNWAARQVPNSGADVVIPNGCSRWPIIESMVTVNSISMENLSQLTLQGAGSQLRVIKNLEIAEGGKFIVNYDVDANPNLIVEGEITQDIIVNRTVEPQRIYYFGSAVESGEIDTPDASKVGWDYGNLYMKSYDHEGFSWVNNADHKFKFSGNMTLVESTSTFGIGNFASSVNKVKLDEKYTFTQRGKVASAKDEFDAQAFLGVGWYANPYPFAIALNPKFAAATTGKVAKSFYARVNENGAWSYSQYNASTGISSPSDFKYLAPFQAFEMRGEDGNLNFDSCGTTLHIKNTGAFTSSEVRQKSAHIEDIDTKTFGKVLRLVAGQGDYYDEIAILFNEEGALTMNDGDTEKRPNTSPALLSQISTNKGGSALVIAHFPSVETLINENITLPLSITKATQATTLHIAALNLYEFKHNGPVYLVDNLTGERVDLTLVDDYLCPNADNLYEGRFELAFSGDELEEGATDMRENIYDESHITIASDGKDEATVTIFGDVAPDATVVAYDILGRELTMKMIGSRTTKLNIANNGMVVVKVVNGSAVKTSKLLMK